MSLTTKQKVFAQEYLVDFNASQAAIRAGYSAKTSRTSGCTLLANPNIQAFIKEQQQKRAEKLEISADRVLKEIAKIAFFDVRNLFENDGIPKNINELDENTSGAICGLDVVTVGNSDSGLGQVLKYKLADKNAGLEKLCKYLGLFKEDAANSNENPEPKQIVFTVVDARTKHPAE